jgi:hypothetical protein
MKDAKEQISVKLDPEVRAAVERAAHAEHRSVSGQIRFLIAIGIEAQAGPQQGRSTT